MPRLTEGQVRRLVDRYDSGANLAAVAAEFDVSAATVSRIITGKIWTSVTGGVNRSRHGEETAYRLAHVQSRIDQGCRNKAIIAAELGISRQAVDKIIRTNHLLNDGK